MNSTTTQIAQNAISLYDVFSTIGIVAVLGAFLYIGRKLQILDEVQSTTNKIKTNVKVVSDFLIRNNSNFNPSELQTYSPFQLTADGEKLVKDIGFDKIFAEHKEDFFTWIDSQTPKLKYDVEIAAIESILALYEHDYMSFLKVFFYNNPTRSIQDTAPTLGVYVREKYLEEHPEITQ